MLAKSGAIDWPGLRAFRPKKVAWCSSQETGPKRPVGRVWNNSNEGIGYCILLALMKSISFLFLFCISVGLNFCSYCIAVSNSDVVNVLFHIVLLNADPCVLVRCSSFVYEDVTWC